MQTRGYFDASVGIRKRGETNGSEYQVTYFIDPGERYKLASVKINVTSPTGNPLFTEEDLRSRMKGLSLIAVRRAFSTRTLPLDRAKFAGTLGGSTDLAWIGTPRDAETKFALEIAPPSAPNSQEIPLTLEARGIYRGSRDELVVQQMHAATPATRVSAEGTLSSTATAKFSLTTTDLREWEPLLVAQGGRPLPIVLRGRATFTGTAAGRLHDLHIAGNLQITDFDSVVPPSAQRPETRVHWDTAAADLQYSRAGFSARNATLVHDKTQIAFDLNAAMRGGSFSNTTPVSGHVNISNGDIAEILSLAGYAYPVSGNVNLNAQFSGSMGDPAGNGHVDVSNAVAYGQPIAKIQSDIAFANGEAQFNNFSATEDGATIAGTAAYGLSSKTYRLNLNGKNFDLSRVEKLQKERFTVAGRLDFTASGTGNLDAPSLNADIHLREVMALEEAFQTAASGYTEAVTEFHIVGGLHPDLPFQYFLDLVSGLKQRFPQVHLKAFTMIPACVVCGKATRELDDVCEALVPVAIRRDIELFYVKKQPEFDKVGNIAALLRFRVDQVRPAPLLAAS